MIWQVSLTKQACQHLDYWEKNQKNTFKKCTAILKLLETDPMNLKTIGKPEWLTGSLSGHMSRRITGKDRCVYQVFQIEKIIKVIQMRFHYDEK